MDKPSSDIKKNPVEPLRPVVAPIPEPSSHHVKVVFPAALERLMSNAALNKATEILIERETNRTRVRQRIRGVLITDLRVPLNSSDVAEAFGFVSKEGDLRQEDQLKWAAFQTEASFGNEPYVCRFCLSETKNFGLITIHLSPTADKPFNPVAWGMGPNQAQLLESFLATSHGLVLFCGTETDDLVSTMQSAAKQLATPERHVIAVSSQSQPWFPGVEQFVSGGDPKAFSRMLKVAFRHEPDLVIANPVDQKDHLDICLSEAIRGRLVFARLPAFDVADAIMQMLSMGVESYLIGAGLIGVVVQRTLRLNCQTCQEKENVSRDRLKEIGIPTGMQPAAFFHGKGCENCFKTGFDRETNIFEIIETTDDLRNRLSRNIKSEDLRSIMKSSGLMTLRQVAVHKAISGQTSLAEVFRVTP